MTTTGTPGKRGKTSPKEVQRLLRSVDVAENADTVRTHRFQSSMEAIGAGVMESMTPGMEEWFWQDPTNAHGHKLWHVVNWDCKRLEKHLFEWEFSGQRYVWNVIHNGRLITAARYVPRNLLDHRDDEHANTGYWKEEYAPHHDRYLSLGDCARGAALRLMDQRNYAGQPDRPEENWGPGLEMPWHLLTLGTITA